MSPRLMITLDANEAVAHVAHRSNEVVILYPITPFSPMGEWCDEWSAAGKRNLEHGARSHGDAIGGRAFAVVALFRPGGRRRPSRPCKACS